MIAKQITKGVCLMKQNEDNRIWVAVFNKKNELITKYPDRPLSYVKKALTKKEKQMELFDEFKNDKRQIE